MPDGNIPTSEEEASWCHGPCKPHEPDYTFQPIKLELSDFSNWRRPYPSIGGWQSFCPECQGIMEVDYHRGESVCSECGLVDNTLILDARPIPTKRTDNTGVYVRPNAHINPKYKNKLERCKNDLETNNIIWKSRTPYEARDKKARSLVMIDRRIEIIIKSLRGSDRIVDLGLIHGKMPIIQRIYTDKYGPITREQVRNSYNRFVDRQTERINHFIEIVLFKASSDGWRRIVRGRIWKDTLSEKDHPARFVYIGTERHQLRVGWADNKKFNAKALDYFRKTQVREIIKNPKAPITITKIYNFNGIEQKIVFKDIDNLLIISGEEADKHFENFFLSEAIKRGYLQRCPGTNEVCLAAVETFKLRFSQLGGFADARFYDATPYMPHPNSMAENAKNGD